MATLDDKLMGEKLHYYCSSSEDEGDEDKNESRDGQGASAAGGSGPVAPPQPDGGANTGPKGVIEDWRRFKQLETEKKAEQEAERVALAKKLSLTCRTDREDQEAKEREQRLEAEFDGLLDEEEFLQSYIQKRMAEMMQSQVNNKKFGVLTELFSGEDFLSTIDSPEDKSSVVIIFIYERTSPSCKTVISCAKEIAKDHPHIKFCSIEATSVGLSHHFKVGGVPAVLVYKSGELLSNFVRITDALGDDFYPSDLESFLIEHGVLVDKELVPTIVRGPAAHADDDISD